MRVRSIVVFSHLRWKSVFQRPQHLLTRLARDHEVWFVEEPIADGERRLELIRDESGVTVCVPHSNIEEAGFSIAQMEVLAPMVRELVARAPRPLASWLYTPMALPLADQIDADVLVYDCMDELSGFLFAPVELREREDQLLRRADLVFTGGRSLYRSKRGRNPHVYCFPSSVDREHFARALTTAEAADQTGIARPRLGFYGVIDERIDYDLIDKVAAARPEWQLIMIGPVVKVDANILPRRTNIHYLGARDYRQLPSYLAGWDVCLLPFARNAATQFISPTKTLEYMAADRPIVSTPIVDVAEPYGEVVLLADTPAQFIAACERALQPTDREREQRSTAMRSVVASTSWDQTAEEMSGLIDRALQAASADGSVLTPCNAVQEEME